MGYMYPVYPLMYPVYPHLSDPYDQIAFNDK